MNNCPKISVIIPCYNSQKHINKCINSIIAQSYTKFELIIVNDCSTDNTHKIIQKYTYKDNRIIVVNHTKNKGAHAARLSGINIARGIYIAFIDSDDYVDVDYLEKLYNATEGEAIDMVCLSGHYQKFRLLQIKKQDISNWKFETNFDPYTYILIELNNCFYEYFTQCILNGIKSNIIIDNIKCELSDELYNEFNYLNDYTDSLYTQEIQAILSKNYCKIYSIAKSKITHKRKMRFYLSKWL